MYKVTIKCAGMKPEELARQLENRTRRFKVWVYNKVAYASVDLKAMDELNELRSILSKDGEFNVDCIKVEKLSGQWGR